jgi:two-component system, chemotaxis family, CheB/CheR fusion protein
MNIYAMAREGLQNELPGAIRKAKQGSDPVKLNNLKIGTNGGTQIVDITLQQIEKPEAIKGTIIIVFTDVANIPRQAGKKSKKPGIKIQQFANRNWKLNCNVPMKNCKAFAKRCKPRRKS